jgi:hypothetical protein
VLSFYERQQLLCQGDVIPEMIPKRKDLEVEWEASLESEKKGDKEKEESQRGSLTKMKEGAGVDVTDSWDHEKVVSGAHIAWGHESRATCEMVTRIWSPPLDICTPEAVVMTHLQQRQRERRVRMLEKRMTCQRKKIHASPSRNTIEWHFWWQAGRGWCDSSAWCPWRECSEWNFEIVSVVPESDLLDDEEKHEHEEEGPLDDKVCDDECDVLANKFLLPVRRGKYNSSGWCLWRWRCGTCDQEDIELWSGKGSMAEVTMMREEGDGMWEVRWRGRERRDLRKCFEEDHDEWDNVREKKMERRRQKRRQRGKGN